MERSVINMEYDIEVAEMCRMAGLETVLKTIHYLCNGAIETYKDLENEEAVEVWEHNKWIIDKCILDWKHSYEPWD